MPALAKSCADRASLADKQFQSTIRKVREKRLPRLTAQSVASQGLTPRDLLRRVGLQDDQVSCCIPMANSTLRGVLSARTDWKQGLKETTRFCALLCVSYEGFAQAWLNRRRQDDAEWDELVEQL